MKCPLTQEQAASLSIMRAVLAAWSSVLPEFDFSQVLVATEHEFFPSKTDLDPRVERVGVMGPWPGAARPSVFIPFPPPRRVWWGEWVTKTGEHRSDRYGCSVSGFPMPEDVSIEKIIEWFMLRVVPWIWQGHFAGAIASPGFRERVQLFLLAGMAA